MDITALEKTWMELAAPFSTDGALIAQEFQNIVTQYSAAGRYYHNLDHLYALFNLQQAYAAQVHDHEVLAFAIFFHDLVYDVLRSDNEAASARAAERFLEQTTFPADKTALVAAYIRATRSHSADNNDPDLFLFLDFDLSILGAPPDVYRQYAQQIRREYAVYPDEVYNAGRKKVLAHFLEMPAIYRTTLFRERYEAQARRNMQEEAAGLLGPE